MCRAVNPSKSAQLETAVAALQSKWGTNVVRPLTEIGAISRPLLTGFPVLDSALAPTGIPYGGLTEVFGYPSSGMTTFAYHLVAQAQGAERYAIYIDLEGTFDPDHAVRTGIALDRLFLARPDSDVRALDLARDLLGSGSIAIIAFDMGQLISGQDRLYRLTTFLLHAQCVLLRMEMLSSGADARHITSSPASVRLLIERQRWIEVHGDIIGVHSAVHILKSRHGMGRQVGLDLHFDTTPDEAKT